MNKLLCTPCWECVGNDIKKYESKPIKLVAQHCNKKHKNKDSISCYEGFTRWYLKELKAMYEMD